MNLAAQNAQAMQTFGDARAAGLLDAPKIAALLQPYVDKHILLPRDEYDIYAALREFFVIEDSDRAIAACAALQIFSAELGEVRSLAVSAAHQRRGLGRRMLAATEHAAQKIGLRRIFALTYEVAFFERAGYHIVDMRELPEKVWGVCINCRKFQNCDETALLKHL